MRVLPIGLAIVKGSGVLLVGIGLPRAATVTAR
jgi:hypothetical protein